MFCSYHGFPWGDNIEFLTHFICTNGIASRNRFHTVLDTCFRRILSCSLFCRCFKPSVAWSGKCAKFGREVGLAALVIDLGFMLTYFAVLSMTHGFRDCFEGLIFLCSIRKRVSRSFLYPHVSKSKIKTSLTYLRSC